MKYFVLHTLRINVVKCTGKGRNLNTLRRYVFSCLGGKQPTDACIIKFRIALIAGQVTLYRRETRVLTGTRTTQSSPGLSAAVFSRRHTLNPAG